MHDLAAGIAIGALGNTDNGYVVNAGAFERLQHRAELALAAVDQQQVRPVAPAPIRILLLEPGKAASEHFAHHREIVARGGLLTLDVELAILVLEEPLRPGDDHRADGIGPHDVAVVVDLDPLGRLGKLEHLGQGA